MFATALLRNYLCHNMEMETIWLQCKSRTFWNMLASVAKQDQMLSSEQRAQAELKLDYK